MKVLVIEIQSIILLVDLSEKLVEIESKMLNEDEFDGLEGKAVKIIIPSNIIDIYTRLEALLGLKLSGHTDTLTEPSKLIHEL